MNDFSQRWTTRLHEGFPLLKAMQVQLLGDQSGWQLTAPYGPNQNDHHSAFGGSISTLATIAGWLWVSELAGPGVNVVIQTGNTHFLSPLQADLIAHVCPPEASQTARFLHTLQRKGRARMALEITVGDAAGLIAARFNAQYVAG
ncbi:thioesterase [Iodobacter sp. HSC-16F04]|uniref:Thioesterase n=1 Tax=Iodobacter violaceini TaxID=3044271 RepID=A0ABX0KT95_9NEIS|nr:YiiD C-terminal domain-containing protein [Iodobacter violacea]NHQ87851.1 thioesterase [Iodobacter violacea]